MSAISQDFSSNPRVDDGDSRPAGPESRLDSTRDELRQLFLHEDESEAQGAPEFPRSKVLRMLMNRNALTILAIGAGGFLLMKPRLLRSVIRVVPVGALFRFAVTRFLTRRR